MTMRKHRPAEGSDPDTAKVAVQWPCDNCGRWVLRMIPCKLVPAYQSGRERFLCWSCSRPPDKTRSLFGDWLDEQRQRGG